MTETPTRLDERYGRTPRATRTTTAIGIITALGFTVVLGAWLWWGGVLETSSQLQYRDVAHTIVDETEVSVTYEITAAPGAEVACAVQALNGSYGIVGWRVVDIPASDRWTRVFDTTLRTSEPAVTGLLYECWLP
jgi:hypothetical protein